VSLACAAWIGCGSDPASGQAGRAEDLRGTERSIRPRDWTRPEPQSSGDGVLARPAPNGWALGPISYKPIVDDSRLSMQTPLDAPVKRKELIELIWGDAGFPTSKLPSSVELNVANPVASVKIANLARVDRLVVDMGQGVANETFHFVPQSSNGRLVVVHQGHVYDFDEVGVAETIAALVADGYGVLGALMPCLSSIPCPTTIAGPGGIHNDLFDQVIVPPGSGSAVKFFVEHVAVSLNYLRTMAARDAFSPYTEFDMTGVSGGGWTTVLYAALDPTIRVSVPVSGSKPMYLRHCAPGPGCEPEGYGGDREQMDVSIYGKVGYLDLYAMGAAGAGRTQIQVQIRHDGCCFGEDDYGEFNQVPGLTWNQAVRAYENKLQDFFSGDTDRGWFRFEIDETSVGWHLISEATRAQVILAELDGDRRPFAAASSADLYARGPNGMLMHHPPDWSPAPSTVVGTPAVVRESELLQRDEASNLVHLLATTDGWTVEVWPGTIASDPAAVATDDRIDAVAVGADSSLWHWSSDLSGLVVCEPTDSKVELVGTPALVASGAARLDAFARRADGGLEHIFSREHRWSSERVTDATFRGFPRAVVTRDGFLRVYARGGDDKLWEASQSKDGAPWALTSIADKTNVPYARISGSPDVSLHPVSGAVVVLSRSPSGGLSRFVQHASAWSYQVIAPPSTPPLATAAFTFSPVGVPGGVFSRGAEGDIWFHAFSTGWSRTSHLVY
jgi:hypothetical protein